MSDSLFAVDFDLLVSDFILPSASDDEVHNSRHITGNTRWHLVVSATSVNSLISGGYPVIHNTYGIYLGLDYNEPVPNTCVSNIPKAGYCIS